MKTRLIFSAANFLFISFVLGFVSSVCAQTNLPIKVKPAGLRVVAPGFGDQQPRPFNYSSGMEVSLLVEAGPLPIVSINGEDCALDQMNDSQGAVLLKGPRRFVMNPDISDDGKRAIVEFECFPPTRGANEITASGYLKIVVGKQRKSCEIKDVPLVNGPLDVPGLKVSIKDVGKALWGSAGTRVVINVQGKTASLLESVVFLDKDRKPIPSKSEDNSRQVFYKGGMKEEFQYRNLRFILPADIVSATLQFNIWSETETVKVPFQFATGLGL